MKDTVVPFEALQATVSHCRSLGAIVSYCEALRDIQRVISNCYVTLKITVSAFESEIANLC